MSTTTIRIEEDLKSRLATAAQQMGKSTHAFIVEALADRVRQIEQENAFLALAHTRWATLRATGNTVAWDDAKSYLTARTNAQSDGDHPRKPVTHTLTK